MANSMVGATGLRPPKPSIPGYSVKQIQNFSPQQMQLLQERYGDVSPESFTSKLAHGDQSQFEQMERPALRQFNELQGGLASRFSQMSPGALSSRRSSGFQNTMNQAQQDFAGQLQSRRQDLQRQAMKDLWGMSSDLFNTNPYENKMTEKKKSFWEKLIGGVASSAPLVSAGIGGVFGGLPGATAGFEFGNSFSNAYGG